MIWSWIAIFLIGSLAGSNGQCGGKEINITGGNGVISSPNNSKEYGRSANCSWNFTPSEDYALVLTITYQRLYIVTLGNIKLCLGSYSLTINNDTQECTRYVDATYSGSLIEPFEYFDSMCGSDAENNVRVQYVSDGRTYNGSGAVTGTMGFKIQYKFLQCSTVIETTTEYDQQASTNPDNNHPVSTTNVAPHSTVATISATEITQTDTTTKSAITDTENDDAASKETDGNSDGISDTAKLFLVSIPGFIGIIILVVTAIVFCRKRGNKSQKYKNFEKDNVGENKMENAESPIQEPDHDTATAENNEPTTSTIQDEETPYAIMYSALARKDKEGDANELLWDEKKTSAIEEDEHKYDMYSAVVRKTEGGDKKTIHV